METWDVHPLKRIKHLKFKFFLYITIHGVCSHLSHPVTSASQKHTRVCIFVNTDLNGLQSRNILDPVISFCMPRIFGLPCNLKLKKLKKCLKWPGGCDMYRCEQTFWWYFQENLGPTSLFGDKIWLDLEIYLFTIF